MGSCALALLIGQAAYGAFEESGRLLFLDSFDTPRLGNGTGATTPTGDGRQGGGVPGVVSGKAELVPGKKGTALALSGDSRVTYEPFTTVHLLGGEAAFWIKLNYDPNVKNEKTRGDLRNQLFLTCVAPEWSRVVVYTCLKDVCVGVWQPDGNLTQSLAVPQEWHQDEWRHLKLSWGNALEIWVDGEKRKSVPWDGLFGPVQVDPEKLRLCIGCWTTGTMDSEFTIDELAVFGPRLGNLGCRPRVSVPLLDGEPAMTGTLEDPFWQKAGQVTGFVGLAKRELDPDQPAVLMAYTTAGLYVGAKVPLPGGRRPQAMLASHDAAVESEDAIEIFLQPSPASPACVQLLASAIGTRADYRHSDKGEVDKGYNPDWRVATGGKEGEWTIEVFVPFTALGLPGPPKSGDVWGANFAVDSAGGVGLARTWAFTDANFVQPRTFGELLFTGSARAVREESFAEFGAGNPAIRLKVLGGLTPAVTARAEFFDSTGKSVRDVQFRMSDGPAAVIGAQSLPAGVYTARLSAADEAGTQYLRQNVLFRAVNPFALTVENYPYAGVAEAAATVATLGDRLGKVVVQLFVPGEQALATQTAGPVVGGRAVARLNTADLAPGDYVIHAAAMDAQGETLATAKQALRIFPQPAWWKNDLGRDHSVPPPWTPVKATDQGFAVWGRDYQFGNGAFPRQIVNQGTPMFTAAPRFLLRARGEQGDLVAAVRQPPGPGFPDQVELQAATTVGGVTVRAKGTLEFDGMYRLDLDLSPGGTDTIQSLALELPLPRELARFLLTSNGWSCSIAEIQGPYKAQFAPYFWLGNDDMGLAVFTESDQYWSPRDGTAMEIIPSADTALLRFSIIRAPRALKRPVSYSFGLMASPVRPILDGDPFVWFLYGGAPEVSFPESLTYPAQGLFDPGEGTVEFWARRNTAGDGTVEVFNVIPADAKIGVIRCLASSALHVDVNDQRLLTAKASLDATDFAHVALVWDATAVALYVNGQCSGSAEPTGAFRAVLAGAGESGGELRFGDRSDTVSCPAVDVDDIRVSGTARYQGNAIAVPGGPLTKDADTRLLDPLDETFVPDGEDGLTAAGGCPSIGCRFIAGKFGRALQIRIGPTRSAQELIKGLGATFGLAWSWHADATGVGMSAEKSWPPTMFAGVDPGLKPRVDLFHSYGLQILPYVGYPAIGGPSPLVDQFGDEWAVKPRSTMPYPPPPGHYMLNCDLTARGVADYVAAGALWLMQDHQVDGVYTDGSACVRPSENLYAGAGYVEGNGALRPTTPIFGVREGMKRLYRVVKSRKPDGIVCNHMSFNLLLPTLSFSDIHFTGEHEDYDHPLTVRLRFSSRPWGLQQTTLVDVQRYTPWHTQLALLVGTSILETGYPAAGDRMRKWTNLRNAYQAFGYRSAEWVPYFKNLGTYYADDDAKSPVSLYYHRGRDALLIVGNTEAQPRTASVQVHLKAFGLENAALRARNALTEVPIALTPDGRLSVPVRARSFTLVALERQP
jgi:hypothetical protein